jgi:predicted ester cyclase
MPDTTSLRERRLATVREHMESENTHDFDVTMATFDHPRYEIIPTGEIHDGPEAVAAYFETSRKAFPDQRNENRILRASDEAIIAEFDLLGTHLGEFRGIAPTGRSYRVRACAIFEFLPESDRIICERVYLDAATIARQLFDEADAAA